MGDADKVEAKDIVMRNVACNGENGGTMNFSKGKGGEWSHVKTQIMVVSVFEMHTNEFDGEKNEAVVKLSDCGRQIVSASVKPDGHVSFDMKIGKFKDDQGVKDVWECVWPKKAGTTFPLDAQLTFKYTSPTDKKERICEGHKVQLSNPETPPKKACVIL